jgi:phosphoserine phosphatase SerB
MNNVEKNHHIQVSITDQLMHLWSGGKMIRTYKISTAKKGMGFLPESFRTPTGNFIIAEKIGDNLPIGTIFKKREPVGIWQQGDVVDGDLITTRLVRIHGLDEENSNTLDRCIYIHGTNHENLLGEPASHGCVRVSNENMIELYDFITLETTMTIDPTTKSGGKLIFFDCDSTLSSIEGIDELARAKGSEVFDQVVALTNAAMNGEIPLNEVFPRRMEIIQPDQETCAKVAQLYIDHIVPDVKETLEALRNNGWTPIIISGGFEPLIRPFADFLGIEHVEAVPLYFDENGNYAGYRNDFPTTYNGGKPEIIRDWKNALLPTVTVMVGDGISDLETQNEVDHFIGFGGVVVRDLVKNQAQHFVTDLKEIKSILSQQKTSKLLGGFL